VINLLVRVGESPNHKDLHNHHLLHIHHPSSLGFIPINYNDLKSA
jgi:hypothetical protein